MAKRAAMDSSLHMNIFVVTLLFKSLIRQAHQKIENVYFVVLTKFLHPTEILQGIPLFRIERDSLDTQGFVIMLRQSKWTSVKDGLSASGLLHSKVNH